MTPLQHDIKCAIARNPEGSFVTQSNRQDMLLQAARALQKVLGFSVRKLKNLKPFHVEELVNHWMDSGLAVGTLKNRMAALRWLANKIGKRGLVAKSNAHYGIPKRQYVNPERARKKAEQATEVDLTEIEDPYLRYPLLIEHHFGVRREEAHKIQVHRADYGSYLRLKGSWCKNGRRRTIPIDTVAQRELLDEIKKFLPRNASLIPPHLTYAQAINRYEYQCRKRGIRFPHGLRYDYFQRRYSTLTGWECSARYGPTRRQMTAEQREIDSRVRLQISREGGHGRRNIMSTYLGP